MSWDPKSETPIDYIVRMSIRLREALIAADADAEILEYVDALTSEACALSVGGPGSQRPA